MTVGVLALLGQVVLLRELLVAGFGVEVLYILGLATWLLWTALGTGAAALSSSFSPHLYRPLLILAGTAIPISVVFVRYAHGLFGGVPGAYLALGQQLVLVLLALLLPGMLLGFLFRLAAGRFVAAGGTLGRAYAWESLGSVIGGLASTLLLAFHVTNYTQALLCMLVAGLAVMPRLKRSRCCVLPLASVWLILTVLALAIAPQTDRVLTGRTFPDLIAGYDSPYGRISITKRAGQTVVFVNNTLAYESESVEAEPLVHLAALTLNESPQRVLLLGGGVNGLLAEVLATQPVHTDYVDIDRMLLEDIRPVLPVELAEAFDHPAVTTHVGDPRRFLHRSAETYDLIISGMPPPTSLQTNRYYTVEFMRQVAAHLEADGTFAFALPSAENYWTPVLAKRNASIYSAMREVFGATRILAGQSELYMGRTRKPFPSPEVQALRFEQRVPETRLVTLPYIRYRLTNQRNAIALEKLEAARAPVNADLNPAGYRFALQWWFSKFLPELGFTETGRSEMTRWLWLGGVAVPIMLALLIARRRRSEKGRLLVLAWLAGFLGMLLETVILVYFQVKYGVLFRDIGLLLTGFMAGLALGGWLMSARLERSAANNLSLHKTGAALGVLLLGGGLAVVFHTQATLGAALWIGAQLLTGLFTAGLFATAAHGFNANAGEHISPLYGADLAGGLMGSVLASLVLIPQFGLLWPLWLIAALAVLATAA